MSTLNKGIIAIIIIIIIIIIVIIIMVIITEKMQAIKFAPQVN